MPEYYSMNMQCVLCTFSVSFSLGRADDFSTFVDFSFGVFVAKSERFKFILKISREILENSCKSPTIKRIFSHNGGKSRPLPQSVRSPTFQKSPLHPALAGCATKTLFARIKSRNDEKKSRMSLVKIKWF